mgnify:CR=1 FL=1
MYMYIDVIDKSSDHPTIRPIYSLEVLKYHEFLFQ